MSKGAQGIFRRNNPINEARAETVKIWGAQECVYVSIGTGPAPNTSLEGNLLNIAQTMTDIVTHTEAVHQDFVRILPELVTNRLYFRFNVKNGRMRDVGLEEHTKVKEISQCTNAYLEEDEQEREVLECAKVLLRAGRRSEGQDAACPSV